MQESKQRIAIVNKDKCKPKNCNLECKKACPINMQGKMCIQVEKTNVTVELSELLCIGCGLCVQRCPFKALKIINLPKNMENQTTHRYGKNSFKLHRLPTPRRGQVLGLVGTNGIGKSTALQILGNKLMPNLGRFDENKKTTWQDVLKHFRGSELQNFFTNMLEDKLKSSMKPQYVDNISQFVKGTIKSIVASKDQKGVSKQLIEDLDLGGLVDRDLSQLSGGELQRTAIMIVAMQNVGIYMFDEPSCYLDVKQRIKSAKVIRDVVASDNYVIVVEHDLATLDYLSDFVCCLYGEPTAYGVVTMPYGVREGINIFLAGFVPGENMRFRDDELTFKIAEAVEEVEVRSFQEYKYPQLEKAQGDFQLTVYPGKFSSSQITVMLGENGTGKTTFIRLLAGVDKGVKGVPEMAVSYKPQKITPKFEGSVRELLMSKLQQTYSHPQFNSDVCKPMKLDDIIDLQVQKLSGGELQRVALILALGKPANVYLLDEPSSYLDSEQRIITAKVIKRFIINSRKSAFIVEHDFIMATYLADQVVVFDGQPGKKCYANSPQSLVDGMNKFLELMGITFRRDPNNYRPRINKLDSTKDREQKESGNHFCTDE